MRINFTLTLEERRIWHKKEDKRTFCKVVLILHFCHISNTLSSFFFFLSPYFLICGTSAEVQLDGTPLLSSFQCKRRSPSSSAWPSYSVVVEQGPVGHVMSAVPPRTAHIAAPQFTVSCPFASEPHYSHQAEAKTKT